MVPARLLPRVHDLLCPLARLAKENERAMELQLKLAREVEAREKAEQLRAELAADLNVANRKLSGATERIVLMTGEMREGACEAPLANCPCAPPPHIIAPLRESEEHHEAEAILRKYDELEAELEARQQRAEQVGGSLEMSSHISLGLSSAIRWAQAEARCAEAEARAAPLEAALSESAAQVSHGLKTGLGASGCFQQLAPCCRCLSLGHRRPLVSLSNTALPSPVPPLRPPSLSRPTSSCGPSSRPSPSRRWRWRPPSLRSLRS